MSYYDEPPVDFEAQEIPYDAIHIPIGEKYEKDFIPHLGLEEYLTDFGNRKWPEGLHIYVDWKKVIDEWEASEYIFMTENEAYFLDQDLADFFIKDSFKPKI